MQEDFKNFIEKVRSSANIVDVIGGYVPLKKRGNKHWACCPFHGEKTPSFAVDENKQLFYCFGCHLGGDVFKFIEKKEGLNFVDAVKRLAEHYNIPVPEREKSPEDVRREKEFSRLTEVNLWAAKYFAACLNHEKIGKRAREYLINRGITPDIISDFQIGYAKNSYEDLVDALATKNINYAEVLEAGLALEGRSVKPYNKFRDRVMIPIKNPRGKIVGFGGRVLDDGEPKYLNTGQTKIFNKRYLLFGFDLAQKVMREKGYAVVVEGYMDVISLHAAGFRNVVASMGTAFSQEQAGILRRNVPKVIFCYDSDKAGRTASVRAVSLAKAANLKVQIAGVPMGKDPDEYVRTQGKEAFQYVLDNAQDGLQFQIAETLNNFNLSSINGKISAIKEVTKFFLECTDEIEAEAEIRKLAQKLVIDEGLVKDEYQKAKRAKRRWNVTEAEAEPLPKKELVIENKTEALLVSLLLQDVGLLAQCHANLESLDWQDRRLEKIYKLICVYAEKNADLGGMADELNDEEKSLLVLIRMENGTNGGKEKILADCVHKLRIGQLERRYNLHAGLAAEYEKTDENRVLDELKKCQEIRNEIKELSKK